MSELGEVVAAVHPTIAPFAVGTTPEGEWEARLGRGDRAFTMEAVHEGFLLHYGEARAFTAEMDPDLRLLAGDSLYALGLERLAERGDLAAVAELADLISLSAQAQAEGRPEAVRGLWEVTLQRFSA
ncbi:MAG: hypothetical protein QOH76_1183 [Thermoleophilaceae bacterium]|jgi:hypothetical protein|nr:hypothetical protein [Thermoleophilaceae bacterium]